MTRPRFTAGATGAATAPARPYRQFLPADRRRPGQHTPATTCRLFAAPSSSQRSPPRPTTRPGPDGQPVIETVETVSPPDIKGALWWLERRLPALFGRGLEQAGQHRQHPRPRKAAARGAPDRRPHGTPQQAQEAARSRQRRQSFKLATCREHPPLDQTALAPGRVNRVPGCVHLVDICPASTTSSSFPGADLKSAGSAQVAPARRDPPRPRCRGRPGSSTEVAATRVCGCMFGPPQAARPSSPPRRWPRQGHPGRQRGGLRPLQPGSRPGGESGARLHITAPAARRTRGHQAGSASTSGLSSTGRRALVHLQPLPGPAPAPVAVKKCARSGHTAAGRRLIGGHHMPEVPQPASPVDSRHNSPERPPISQHHRTPVPKTRRPAYPRSEPSLTRRCRWGRCLKS